jgi:nucleoside-diphosphate-sugar epimerase
VVVGGDGYIGSLLVPQLAASGWRVQIPSRHERDRESDMEAPIVRQHVDSPAGLAHLDLLPPADHFALVNLGIGAGRKPNGDLRAWVDALHALVARLHHHGGEVVSINVGSVTEHSAWPRPSNYTRAKIAVRRAVFDASIFDWHVIFGIVYPGNPRMDGEVEPWLPLLARTGRLLLSVGVDVIRRADVADALMALIDGGHDAITWANDRPCEVWVAGEHVSFGELLQRCYGEAWTRCRLHVRPPHGDMVRLAITRALARCLRSRWPLAERFSRLAELASMPPHRRDSPFNHYALISRRWASVGPSAPTRELGGSRFQLTLCDGVALLHSKP